MSIDEYFTLTEHGSALVIQPKCHGGAFAEESSRAVWSDVLDRIRTLKCGVVMDLDALSFFGSTILDLIATIHKCVQTLDKSVAVANVSKTGREVLEIARFDKLVTVYSSLEEAVAGVQ